MDSVADEIAFPLTPGRWLAQRGLGNAETLRQMLVLVEQESGVSLQPTPGAGRLIDHDLDALLVQSFQHSRKAQRPVLEVLRDSLADQPYIPKPGSRSSLSEPLSSPSTPADSAQWDAQKVEKILEDFLSEQRSLFDLQRDEQRRLWNQSWEHSLRKAEVSFREKVAETEASYSEALAEFQARQGADLASITQLTEALSDLDRRVRSLQRLLAEREWEASEAKEMNARLEKLTQTAHTVAKQQQQAGLTLQKGLRETLNQAEKMRLLLPAQVSLGVFSGVMLTSLLHLAFPSKFQTVGNALLLMSATIFMVAIWWWKKD